MKYSPTPMLKAALAYAQKLKWAVLPLHTVKNGQCSCGRPDCTSPGKHPRVARGVHDATTDPSVIIGWWRRWPNANIGIRTGAASGFFVVDVDGEEGEEALRDLERQWGELPETVEQITGSGGRHILFRYPQNVDIRPKVRIMPGLDIRANDSYIVVAPSIHVSGRRYCWEIEHRPLEVPIAEPPQWLIDVIKADAGDIKNEPTEDMPSIGEWSKALDSLVEGQRNDTLYRYACHLLAHGLSCQETAKIIRALNKVYGQPPLPDDEVDRLLKSAFEWRSEKHERRQDTGIRRRS